MIGLQRIVLAAALGVSSLPTALIAQRPAPIAIGPRETTLAAEMEYPAARVYRVRLLPDSVETRRPRIAPFAIGGMIVGGLVGALLAASYDFCGEPSPGYSCSSTDTGTGVVIGAGVGLLAGLVTWTVVAHRPPPPEPPAR